MLNSKLRKRLVLILSNAANTLLLPVFNIAVSLLVIRLASAALWGQFVSVLILMNLAIHIMYWGSKEYLLRAFSLSPGNIREIWQNNIVSRLPLFAVFTVILLFLPIAGFRKLLLILWGFGALLFQSFDALVLYQRRFLQALFLEFFTIGIIVIILISGKLPIDTDLLIMLFTAAVWLKAFGLGFLFRETVLHKISGRFEKAFFKAALPFFLLGLSGMLQSRTDLYCVAYFLDQEAVGKYQVFINLLIYIQVMASLILQPFLKNIYRLKAESIRKIAYRLFAAGLLLTLPALVVIFYLLNHIYHFEIDQYFLYWGGLFVVPIYFYLPTIYSLYKLKQEQKVLWVNIAGIIINFILNIIIINMVGLIGAIIASAVSQWVMLVLYRYYEQKWIGNAEITLS